MIGYWERLGRLGWSTAITPVRSAPWSIVAACNSVHNEATPEAVEQRRRVALSRVLAIHCAGIPIVAGTDYGVPAHSLHRELELYVEAGLTPLEALQFGCRDLTAEVEVPSVNTRRVC